jgi:hypothetical protein
VEEFVNFPEILNMKELIEQNILNSSETDS